MYKLTVTDTEELVGEMKGPSLRGLFRCTFRKSPEDSLSLIQRLKSSEAGLVENLRRPSENESARQIDMQ